MSTLENKRRASGSYCPNSANSQQCQQFFFQKSPNRTNSANRCKHCSVERAWEHLCVNVFKIQYNQCSCQINSCWQHFGTVTQRHLRKQNQRSFANVRQPHITNSVIKLIKDGFLEDSIVLGKQRSEVGKQRSGPVRKILVWLKSRPKRKFGLNR